MHPSAAGQNGTGGNRGGTVHNGSGSVTLACSCAEARLGAHAHGRWIPPNQSPCKSKGRTLGWRRWPGPELAVPGKGRTSGESEMGADQTGFMDTRRAATWLGLSHRTLEGYRVSGGGPAFHRFGNRVRYRRSDLDAWARMHRAVTTAQADRLRAA